MHDSKTLLITADANEANKISKWLDSWDYPVKTIDLENQTIMKEDLLNYDLILLDSLFKDKFEDMGFKNKQNYRICPILCFASSGENSNLEQSENYIRLKKPMDAKDLKYAVEMAIYKYKMQKNLQETEEKYKLLLENAEDLIMVIREDGMFVLVNQSAANYFGRLTEDFDGKNMWDIFPKENADSQMRSVKRAIRSRKTSMKIEKTNINHQVKWFNTKIQPITNFDGTVNSAQIIARDITAQKNIENNLLERENFLTGTLNDMHTFVSVLKPTGEIIFVNNTPLELMGKSLEDVEGELFYETPWWNYSKDIQELIKRDIELCASGKTLSHEIEINTLNGLVWIDYSMHPVYDNHGNVKYLVPEGRDISRIKNAKKALQVEKNHLMNITENVPFGMVFIDKNGDYKYINPKFREMFGYTDKDIPKGKAWFKKVFKNPEKRLNAIMAWKEDFENAMPGEKKPRTFPITCKNGDSKIIEFVPVLLDDNEYLMTVEDVTERIIADKALKQSEERFRTVASSAVDAIIITDLGGTIVFCNNSVQRVFGYNEDDIIGESVNQLIPGRYLDEFIRKQEQFRLTGRHMLSGKLFESYGYRKDGSEFPIEISITAWEINGEKFTTSIIRDITERKLVEYELKSSEEKFRQMTENIQEVFWIIDPKMSQILYISPAYHKIWGRSRESLFDNPRSWIESIHPEDRKQVVETIFRSPNDVNSGSSGIQYRIVRPDGSIRWIFGKSFPLNDGGKKVKRIAGIAIDITKRINAEEKYRNLFENINIGIIRCTVGTNSRLIDSNPKAMKIFNYKKSELRAIKASYLYKNGEDKIKFDEKVLKYGHVKNEKIKFKKQDGTPFNASVSAYVVKDEFDNPKYIDCIIEDITSFSELEKYIKYDHPIISNSISLLNKFNNY